MNDLSASYPKKSEGSALIVAIMALVILTLIGIAATTTSTLEVQISANDIFGKQAFYNSESVLNVATEILRQTNMSSTHMAPTSPSGKINYAGNFMNAAFVNGPFPLAEVDPPLRSDTPDDVTVSLSGFQSTVDVCRRGTIIEEGNEAEFGSYNAAFAVYDLTAHGNGFQGANYTIQARCRVYIPPPQQ